MLFFRSNEDWLLSAIIKIKVLCMVRILSQSNQLLAGLDVLLISPFRFCCQSSFNQWQLDHETKSSNAKAFALIQSGVIFPFIVLLVSVFECIQLPQHLWECTAFSLHNFSGYKAASEILQG